MAALKYHKEEICHLDLCLVEISLKNRKKKNIFQKTKWREFVTKRLALQKGLQAEENAFV